MSSPSPNAKPPPKPARATLAQAAKESSSTTKRASSSSSSTPAINTTPQSNIVLHVPSRAKHIDQILVFADKHNITNEMLIKVGLRMNGNLLFGSNQRCVAMLVVFKSIMDDIKPNSPSSTTNTSPLPTTHSQSPSIRVGFRSSSDILKELQDLIENSMEFLDFCRPLSVSMTNAYKLLKKEIIKLNQADTDKAIANLKLESNLKDTNVSSTLSTEQQLTISTSDVLKAKYDDQKEQLRRFIDIFIDEEIWSAQRGICENIFSNIATNDVILVYGCSTIVQHVLLHAKTRDKTFKVIVVDSPPHFNGRRMLSFLNNNSIDVSYTLINSLSFVMRQATKVLIGANSMLANGHVMSHIGTSQVALMAKASNVPTLVCCETYKLSDRVHVDSFGCNEVDSEHELGSALNLRYDLTPPEFISMVINEKSTVPAESVPAMLRFRAEKTKTSLYVA